MKRWIYSLVVSILFIFLCLSRLPLLVSAQADTTGQLTVNEKEVTVALKTTKGTTETITSLRMQLYISVETGTLKEEPKFTFDSSISSEVQQAYITKDQEKNYIVDLILSGKKDQSLFNNTENFTLGTLSLTPETEDFEAIVKIIGSDGDTSKTSSVQYMDANGLVTQTIELDNSESVSVCGAKTLLEKLVANVKDELKSETFAEQYTTKSINALRTALINAQNLSDTESTEKITEVYQSLLTASEVGENGLVKADRNVVVAFGNAGVQRGFSAGSGWYANGDKVTLKITPSVGYVFSNWTSDTDRKNVVGKSLEYTFTLQSDSVATYYAWLTEKNYTVSLTSTEGGVASTNSANGQYTYKEEATVTAKENNDYMFVGWKDRYGNTVSVQNPYEFKVLGNTTLTPEFVKTKDDNGKEITYVTVNFYHQSGNLLSSQKVAIGTSKVKAPIDPTKVGFVFKGWSTKHSGATQEDVLALDTTAFEKDTNLYPVFVVQEGKTYTVTVDNELVKTYKPHSVVTLTAEDISGKKFVGWKNSSGNYVSYESNYSFIITGNVVLSKEYVSADSEITKVPTITMEQPIYEDVSDNVYKMTFYFNYDLPEDYQLVDVGVLKLYNQSKEELSLDTSGVVQTSVLSKLGSDGQFYYSKLNYSTDSHTVCGYLIYEDASGVRYTIYSNAIYGSKN